MGGVSVHYIILNPDCTEHNTKQIRTQWIVVRLNIPSSLASTQGSSTPCLVSWTQFKGIECPASLPLCNPTASVNCVWAWRGAGGSWTKHNAPPDAWNKHPPPREAVGRHHGRVGRRKPQPHHFAHENQIGGPLTTSACTCYFVKIISIIKPPNLSRVAFSNFAKTLNMLKKHIKYGSWEREGQVFF